MEVFFGTSGHSVARQVRQSLYALSFCLPEPQAHLPSATSSSAALGSGPLPPAALSSPLERAAFSIPSAARHAPPRRGNLPCRRAEHRVVLGPQKRVFRWSRTFAAESYHRRTGIAGGKTFPPFLYDLKFFDRNGLQILVIF